MTTYERHCIRCGSEGPFRNELALRCLTCDEDAERKRRNYHKVYQAARTRAIRDIIKAHKPEFQGLMEKYQAEIKATVDPEDVVPPVGGANKPITGEQVTAALHDAVTAREGGLRVKIG